MERKSLYNVKFLPEDNAHSCLNPLIYASVSQIIDHNEDYKNTFGNMVCRSVQKGKNVTLFCESKDLITF